MPFRIVFLLWIAIIPTFAVAKQTVLVVCATELRDELSPWTEYRRQQGHTIEFIQNQPFADAVHSQIRDYGRRHPNQVRAIVLFGDCKIERPRAAVDPARHVPTFHLPSPVAAALGSTVLLATDAPFGDLDADGKVDVPVGRMPFRNLDQIAAYVQRVREYESSCDFGSWRHTIDLTAGVGGFGAIVDTAIEAVTRGVLTSQLPPTMQTRVTYASPSSPFFPGFASFQSAVVRNYNEGGLFWVYAGHGQVESLDRVPHAHDGKPILACDHLEPLNCPGSRAPIALLLACYTGAYDAKHDCFAESMLMQPGGPVAVIAGSRMTLPYGNATVATSLIESWFNEKPDTLGEGWLSTLQKLTHPAASKSPTMIDTMASLLSPTARKLPEERREHAHLYNLLGDPLLKLTQPDSCSLEAPTSAAPGESIFVRGLAPHAGKVSVEIHRMLEPSARQLVNLSSQDRYALASRTMLSRNIADTDGKFQIQVRLPAADVRSVSVIARIEGADRFSIGHRRILIQTPSTTTSDRSDRISDLEP